jgi:thiol-disulfide isomerase/thioredoxin
MAPSADPVTGRFTKDGRRRWTASPASTGTQTHSDIPLLVGFWAICCGPCRAIAPIFERAGGNQLEPDLRLVKFDSDAVPELLRSFYIQNIPTLMLVRHGRRLRASPVSCPCLNCWRGPASMLSMKV